MGAADSLLLLILSLCLHTPPYPSLPLTTPHQPFPQRHVPISLLDDALSEDRAQMEPLVPRLPLRRAVEVHGQVRRIGISYLYAINIAQFIKFKFD